LYELIDGVLVEKDMGARESLLAGVLIHLLWAFLDEHDLGVVLGESGMLRLWPGRVRTPDVCFISWDRIPGRVLPRKPIPDLVPDLAIEVLSPGNTRREMELKLRDYFQVGVIESWLVRPKTESVDVYSSPDRFHRFRVEQTLTTKVLPGFSLQLRRLFERAGRPTGR
jgi:Uma2 family endonuclease